LNEIETTSGKNFLFRLDFDDIEQEQLNVYIDVIKAIGKRRIITIRSRTSAGGHGFHLEITIQVYDSMLRKIKNVDSFILGVRYLLNDCYGRVKGDIARMHLDRRVDRLADFKDGRYASEWKMEYDGRSEIKCL